MCNSIKYKKLIIISMVLLWSIAIAFIRNTYALGVIASTVGIVVIVVIGKIEIDIGDWLLFAGLPWFALFYFQVGKNSVIYILLYCSTCYLSYCMGKIISINHECKFGLVCLSIIGIIMYLKGIIINMYFYGQYTKLKWGLFLEEERISESRPTGFYFIIIVSLISFWLFYVRKKPLFSLFFIGTGLSSVIVTLVCGGRMVFLIFIVCLFALGTFLFAEYRKQICGNKWFRIMCVLLSVILIILTLIGYTNRSELLYYYRHSFWSRNGGVINNVRFGWAREQFKAVCANPFGKSRIIFTGRKAVDRYSHNSWTDIGRESGLFPMLFAMLFSVINCINVFVIAKKGKEIERYAVILTFIGMTILCLTDCVSVYWTFRWAVEMYLGGMINGLCYKEKYMRNVSCIVNKKVLIVLMIIGYLFVPIHYVRNQVMGTRNEYIFVSVIYLALIILAIVFFEVDRLNEILLGDESELLWRD